MWTTIATLPVWHIIPPTLPLDGCTAHRQTVPILPLHGHDGTRQRLSQAVQRGQLPHSLLLHGPSGIGKQRLALWLGQLLLCENPGAEPCGRCRSCRYADELAHPDLHWFFPRDRKDVGDTGEEALAELAEAVAGRLQASGLYPPGEGTGIYLPHVRAVVQQAARSPSISRRKVFVIGDADHMVQGGTEDTANAFLKLLEEPPADTTFVLTSSEPGALLPTIRSRVVSIRISTMTEDAVREFLVQDEVSAALDKAGVPKGLDARVRLAAGAPGRLLAAGEKSAAAQEAVRLVDAAAGSRAARYRAAFVQGSSGARGGFSDMLEALTIELRNRAQHAVQHRDDLAALTAARGVAAVEVARERATANVTPQLVTAALLRDLSRELR